MLVGMGLALMNPVTQPDVDVYRDALHLADCAEPLGFESLWAVEHHFTGHSPIPNALQLLSYMAGRTNRIRLGTSVVVLPWHNPIRVAEEVAVLDILSGGRTVIGFGRGSSAVEYGHFGVLQDEGAQRLEEGIECVRGLLDSEIFSYVGKFNRLENVTVRPRPVHRPEAEFYGAAHTERSAKLAGEQGLNLLFSPEGNQDYTDSLIATYRTTAEKAGFSPGELTAHLYVSVAATRKDAVARAERYMQPMVESLARHYTAKPGEINAPDRRIGTDEEITAATAHFIGKHVVGTPDECFEKINGYRERYGLTRFVGELSYGAMPLDEATENMRLFAEQVLPRF